MRGGPTQAPMSEGWSYSEHVQVLPSALLSPTLNPETVAFLVPPDSLSLDQSGNQTSGCGASSTTWRAHYHRA